MSNREIFQSEIEKARSRLNSLFGEETFLSFRNDLRDIYIENKELEDVTEWDKRRWMYTGRQGLDETRRRYITFGTHLDILNLSDAAISLSIGLGVNWLASAVGFPSIPSILIAFAVSLFLYSLNTGLVLAKALVTEIAYPPEEIHMRLDPADLRFRAGWNKGVIQSSASMLGIIIYGVITYPGAASYELGLSIVKWWIALNSVCTFTNTDGLLPPSFRDEVGSRFRSLPYLSRDFIGAEIAYRARYQRFRRRLFYY